VVKNNKVSKHVCPLTDIVNTISRKWFLLTLNVIGNSSKIGFNDILSTIDGISPKALSDTLKQMEKLGLVKRKVINSSPPKVEYSLTIKGKRLRVAALPLLKWASNYTGHKDCPIINPKLLSKLV
jgi:DNA-binding HxlR family transcriptional regulator